MKKIQVIGLPGSGKSTGIENFTQDYHEPLNIYDIRDFSGLQKECEFRKVILRSNKDILAESACGVYLSSSFVVKLIIPIHSVYQNCINRDGFLDEDYLSLLSTQMLRPDYTVSSSADLTVILHELFGVTDLCA